MSGILKISEAASIGLHAMIILAQKQNQLVSVKDIASQLEISGNHLSKVMQRLVKSELVLSIKGNKGGFKLAKPSEEITFLQVYEAIDGRYNPSTCLLNKAFCSHKCIMGELTFSVNKQVEDFFKKTKLSDFLNA